MLTQICSQEFVALEVHSFISAGLKPVNQNNYDNNHDCFDTIAGESIAVEGVSSIAAACVATWCVVTVLITQSSSQQAFIIVCAKWSIKVTDCT